MTVAEMEQRLIALEKAVAQLAERVSRYTGSKASQEDTFTAEEALLPEAECPLIVKVPPNEAQG